MKEKNRILKSLTALALCLGAFLAFAHTLHAQGHDADQHGNDTPLTPHERAYCKSRIVQMPLDSNEGHRLGVYVCGLAPFQFEWSTGDTTPFIHVDSAGKYCVTVTDAFHCKSNSCMVLNPKPNDSCKVHVFIRIIPIKRKGKTLLRAIPMGKPPFQFQWSTGDTTRAVIVPDTGKYCVTVTDSRGCTAERCIVLRRPRHCTVTIHARPIADKGWLLAARGRGMPPLKFHWSTGDTSQSIRVKRPGRYCVSMTDSKGCVARHCIKVPVQEDPKRCFVTFHVIRISDSCFYLKARAVGHPPYRFHWSTGDTSHAIRTCTRGKICLTMTDATGCTDTFCLQLPPRRRIGLNTQQDAPSTATAVRSAIPYPVPTQEDFLIFPNPTEDQLYIVLSDKMQNTEKAPIVLYKIYSLNGYCLSSGTLHADQPVLSISVNHLPSSVYILQLIVDDQILMRRFRVH